MSRTQIALCLGGGGATGAMFQIGALAALEDAVTGFHVNDFDLYIGASSGASVAAALAGGRSVQRIYRAILDPADDYFPLERRHLFRMDLTGWRRAIASGFESLQRGAASIVKPGYQPPSATVLWEQLDRVFDSLPPGVYSLDGYERFLEDFFVRRGVPNNFAAMPRPLRVLAHDVDSGERVIFGRSGFDHEPVTRACIASMALPPLFSPVRIGNRYYFDAGAAQAAHLAAAVEEGAGVLVVINALVPVVTSGGAPVHGRRTSVADKGLLWVASQAERIAGHGALREALGRIKRESSAETILIEPEATDGILFLHNPTSFAARRKILEYAYRTTRARIAKWIDRGSSVLERVGWAIRSASGESLLPPSAPPPPSDRLT